MFPSCQELCKGPDDPQSALIPKANWSPSKRKVPCDVIQGRCSIVGPECDPHGVQNQNVVQVRAQEEFCITLNPLPGTALCHSLSTD